MNLQIEYLSKAMDFCLLLKYEQSIGKNTNKTLVVNTGKRLDHARKSTKDALKTASKRAI